MIFYVVQLSNDWNVDVPSWKYPRNLKLPRVSSPGFGNDSKMMRAPGTRYHQENTIELHRYGDAGWLVWGGVILGSRTDLHVQSVTLTGHIYWDIILEQHIRLFRGVMGAEFLFMDDNARPHRANIVAECLQSEDITSGGVMRRRPPTASHLRGPRKVFSYLKFSYPFLFIFIQLRVKRVISTLRALSRIILQHYGN
ncbi:DDE_3 domain-containing protein [Trichonephila clavipes]|nr:DDE_3 domain-containing protein [Trichonephila clavipes]